MNATNKENVTPLMLASEDGNIDAINVLLSAGADQTIGDTYAVYGDCSKDVLQSIHGSTLLPVKTVVKKVFNQ